MKKPNFKFVFARGLRRTSNFGAVIFALIFVAAFSSPARAAVGININLRVEGSDSTIINTTINLPDGCSIVPSNTSTPSVFTGFKGVCALETAKSDGIISGYGVTDWGFGFSLDSINSVANTADWSQLWTIRVNNVASQVGIDGVALNADDTLLLSYGPWPMEPLQLVAPTSTVYAGQTATLYSQNWNDVSGQFEDRTGVTTFNINGTNIDSATGILEWTPDSAGAQQIFVSAAGKTRSLPLAITVEPVTPPTVDPVVNVAIRYQDQQVFNNPVSVPSSTAFTYTDAADGTALATTTGRNVLSALLAADATSTLFVINNISYYSGFGSFLINCLDINATSTIAACYNWQYVVNGVYPDIGVNQFALNGGEQINFYFGDRYNLSLDKSQYEIGESVSGTLKEYDYQNGLYAPKAQSVLGWLGNADAVIATSTTDSDGAAVFVPAATGTYKIGLENASAWGSYYWPTASFSVTAASATTTTPTPPSGDGGGGGSSSGITHNAIDTGKAINFLIANQNANGSFGSSLYTDWAAMALAANSNASDAREKLKQYLLSDPSPVAGLNPTSDYERRAMALAALGINPYFGTKTDYIQKIVNNFDGQQFGSPDLFNEDIFALFPLLKSGFNSSDPIIASTTKFILSKQNSDGSWGGVDLTAAAIQALVLVPDVDGAVAAVAKAKTYLHTAQKDDGGFGDVYAASWALQAIAALGDTDDQWVKNNKTPNDYLFAEQRADGGLADPAVATSTRVWATSYAIPAALRKPWFGILNSFPKSQSVGSPASGVGGGEIEFPTSTLFIVTSTLSTTTTPALAATTTIAAETPAVSSSPRPVVKILTSSAQSAPVLKSSTKGRKIQSQLEPQGLVAFTSGGEKISAGPSPTSKEKIEKIINTLPLDVSSRQTAKKILALSGGGAAAVGLYLGLKFLKSVV